MTHRRPSYTMSDWLYRDVQQDSDSQAGGQEDDIVV